MAEIPYSQQIEPHETIYCQCGFPVFYCQYRSFAKQKQLGCREYLRETDPELYHYLYGADEALPAAAEQGLADYAVEAAYAASPADALGQPEEGYIEQNYDEESSSGSSQQYQEEQRLKIPLSQIPAFGMPIKPFIKKQPQYVPILQLRIASRGQKKSLTQVFNYEDFFSDPEAVCKEIGKKFSAASGISELPDTGVSIIQVQGSFVEELRQFFVYKGIDNEQIFEAKEGKHKGKKKSQRNSRPRDKR